MNPRIPVTLKEDSFFKGYFIYDSEKSPISFFTYSDKEIAEIITILLNHFGQRNIEMLKKMDADGVSVFSLLDEFMAETDLKKNYSDYIEKNSSTPIIKASIQSHNGVMKLRNKILYYGS